MAHTKVISEFTSLVLWIWVNKIIIVGFRRLTRASMCYCCPTTTQRGNWTNDYWRLSTTPKALACFNHPLPQHPYLEHARSQSATLEHKRTTLRGHDNLWKFWSRLLLTVLTSINVSQPDDFCRHITSKIDGGLVWFCRKGNSDFMIKNWVTHCNF